MRLIIFGATGAVGKHVLKLALESSEYSQIIAPTRRALEASDKLSNPIVDYDNLTGSEDWWKADKAICCLGTTLKLAGSKENFFKIDHDYVINAAKFAFHHGCRKFVYNSSVGANKNSFSFYLKTKGLIEDQLSQIGFESLVFIRPPLLDAGNRPEFRLGEEIFLSFNKVFGNLLPASMSAVKVEAVARCIMSYTNNKASKTQYVEAKEIISDFSF